MWIEIVWELSRAIEIKSLPSRECGLKFFHVLCILPGTLVTPFAGVWIEIDKA